MQRNELHIREALPEDKEQLTAIAIAAKAHWGYPQTWIDSWRDELTVREEALAKLKFKVAAKDGRILGFGAIGPAEMPNAGEIEHLWVLPDAMGMGVGRALFTALRAEAGRLGWRQLFILSDPHAASFYAKLGAQFLAHEPSSIPGRNLPRYCYVLDPDQSEPERSLR